MFSLFTIFILIFSYGPFQVFIFHGFIFIFLFFMCHVPRYNFSCFHVWTFHVFIFHFHLSCLQFSCWPPSCARRVCRPRSRLGFHVFNCHLSCLQLSWFSFHFYLSCFYFHVFNFLKIASRVTKWPPGAPKSPQHDLPELQNGPKLSPEAPGWNCTPVRISLPGASRRQKLILTTLCSVLNDPRELFGAHSPRPPAPVLLLYSSIFTTILYYQ